MVSIVILDYLAFTTILLLSYFDMYLTTIFFTFSFQLWRELLFVDMYYIMKSANLINASAVATTLATVSLLFTTNQKKNFLLNTIGMHFVLIVLADVLYGRVLHKMIHKTSCHFIHKQHHKHTKFVTVVTNYDTSIYEILLIGLSVLIPITLARITIPFSSFILFVHSSAMQHSFYEDSPFFFNFLDIFIKPNKTHKIHHRYPNRHYELVSWFW